MHLRWHRTMANTALTANIRLHSHRNKHHHAASEKICWNESKCEKEIERSEDEAKEGVANGEQGTMNWMHCVLLLRAHKNWSNEWNIFPWAFSLYWQIEMSYWHLLMPNKMAKRQTEEKIGGMRIEESSRLNTITAIQKQWKWQKYFRHVFQFCIDTLIYIFVC